MRGYMLAKLSLLFISITSIELYILFKANQYIGTLPTVLAVFFTGIVGAALSKQQGVEIANRVRNSLTQGKMPADDMIHGLVVLIGGILLLTPGFLTDFFGFTLIFPTTRTFYLKKIKNMLQSKVSSDSIVYTINNKNNK